MMSEKISGIMVYYYFVCKRKLWLFNSDISMEDENELVQIGRFIDDSSYASERKHIMINDEINIDFIERSGVIHEIKKSRKIEEASVWQLVLSKAAWCGKYQGKDRLSPPKADGRCELGSRG